MPRVPSSFMTRVPRKGLFENFVETIEKLSRSVFAPFLRLREEYLVGEVKIEENPWDSDISRGVLYVTTGFVIAFPILIRICLAKVKEGE